MNPTIDHNAFDRATDPLFKLLTDDQLQHLLHWTPDHQLQDRIAELADRAQEGALRADERAEYESYIRANNLLAVLQAVAKRRLSPPSSRSE